MFAASAVTLLEFAWGNWESCCTDVVMFWINSFEIRGRNDVYLVEGDFHFAFISRVWCLLFGLRTELSYFPDGDRSSLTSSCWKLACEHHIQNNTFLSSHSLPSCSSITILLPPSAPPPSAPFLFTGQKSSRVPIDPLVDLFQWVVFTYISLSSTKPPNLTYSASQRIWLFCLTPSLWSQATTERQMITIWKLK